MTRANPEHEAQSAVIAWCDQIARIKYRCEVNGQFPIHSTPNAAKRNFESARFHNREGMRSGIPDLELIVKRGSFCGLAIEMKHGRNKPFPEQVQWLRHYAEQGWSVHVCYSVAEAIAEIEKYMELK